MNMRWYNHLYVGEKAKKKRFWIIQKIRGHKLQNDIYVITPAANGNNILDIYPSMVLSQPYCKDTDLLIIGIAKGYQEALEVTTQIVDDMYQSTGGFDLQRFITRKSSKV